MKVLLVEADAALADAVEGAIASPSVAVERVTAESALACAPRGGVVLFVGPAFEAFCSKWRAGEPRSALLLAAVHDADEAARALDAGADQALLLPPGEAFAAQLRAALRLTERLAHATTAGQPAAGPLHLSDDRFARVLRAVPVGVCLGDRETARIVDVNDAFLDLFGYAREELIGQNAVELGLWASETERKEILRRMAAAGGSLRDVEVGFRTRAGVTRIGLSSWETIDLDGRPHILCILADVTERRRTEDALRRAEQFLRSVVSAAPLMLFVVDARGRFTFVDGEGLAALEPRPKTRMSAFRYFANAPSLVHAFRQALDGRQVGLEVTLGDVVADMRLSPLRDERGEVAGAICVGTDVTARRRAEHARRLAEDRFKAMVSNLPVLVWGIDERGVCTFAEGGVMGIQSSDLMGINLIEAFDREPLLSDPLRRALQGEALTATVQFRGRWYETIYNPMRDEEGTIVGAMGMSVDITERRDAELQHRLMEERLRTVTSNAPVILFAFDPEGHFILVDGAALSHFGVGPEYLIGKHASEVYEPEHLAVVERALRGEEFSIISDMAGRTWDVHFSNTRNESGEIAFVVGLATDITERRRAEQALVQAQKLESLQVLAGGVAHDFNNLLVGILGNAGLALRELPENSPARESILAIETAAHRAADLSRQMLAYAGRGQLRVEPVDLNALVEEMGQILRVTLPRDTQLHYEFASEPPIVMADATQLRQVVMNLVVNAADAIAGPGDITVAISKLEANKELLAKTFLAPDLEPGTYVSLEVRDTGCGMDQQTLSRIFDPFFTTKFTGRGLGLAAVLGIVHGHRGAIRVRSQPGRGSTFTLLFPASQELPSPVSEPAPGEHQWHANGTVLVVDDEPAVRRVVARSLAQHGFTVLEAEDGAEAVEIFEARAGEIGCILLDITMPRMSGQDAFEAIQRIRPGVPVVLMTGYEQDIVSRFPESSLAGFLQKPFELSALHAAVCAAMTGAQGATAPS